MHGTPSVEILEDRWLPSLFTVTNLNDSGAGSLRQAIVDANNETLNPGPDTIQFASSLAGGTINLSTVGDNSIGPSALLVNSSITITGLGGNSGITIARNSAAPNMRLFLVTASGSLTLQNLTLSDGVAQGGNGGASQSGGGGGGAAGFGGAIFNQGTLNVQSSTLTGNLAQGGNGGVANSSSYNGGGGGGGLGGNGSNGALWNGGAGGGPNPGVGANGGAGGTAGTGGGGGGGSNTATGGNAVFGGGGGGGGYSGPGGAGGFGGGGGGGGYFGSPNGGTGGFGGGAGRYAMSSPSTPSRGAQGGGGAGMGGAIFNSATLTITNSTFTGNTAAGGTGGNAGSGLGGAVFNRNGSVTIQNSTLSGNTAAQGGGDVFNLGDAATASVMLSSSIVANTPNGASDFQAQTINGGTSTTSGDHDLIEKQSGFNGTVISTADPLLGPLASNGGPVQTMAPKPGSPALAAGIGATVSTSTPGVPPPPPGSAGVISGTVFHDYNTNGFQDSAEPGLADQTVFLDLNGSGVLQPGDPTALTDANGNFQLTVPSAGTYTVRQLLLGGVLLSAPTSGAYQVTVTNGANVTGENFADVLTSIAVPLTLPPATPFVQQGNANADYVEAIYRAVLDRDADPAGLAGWTAQLNNGTLSRLQVVQGIRNSPEHFAQEISNFYLTLLNRPADPSGLQNWVHQLEAGMREEQVAFDFLDSPEYLSQGDKHFVDAMYQSLLGRSFDAAGEANWLGQLGDDASGNPTHAASLTHEQVIKDFLYSTESETRLTEGYYEVFLQRPADAAGLSGWVQQLQQGAGFLTTGQQFLSSDEFFNRAAQQG